ncbi:MAG: hypothetical protein ACOZE5_00225, partial [Verrucomicrobiota bacterium]
NDEIDAASFRPLRKSWSSSPNNLTNPIFERNDALPITESGFNHECSAERLRYLVRLHLIGFATGLRGPANRRLKNQPCGDQPLPGT